MPNSMVRLPTVCAVSSGVPAVLSLWSVLAVVLPRPYGALAVRPERAPRRSRWGRPHPWDSGGGVSGRLAPVDVLERPRYSASADVLDGLDGLGY
jgi:hypothetical protein